jgi:hypothetical protein
MEQLVRVSSARNGRWRVELVGAVVPPAVAADTREAVSVARRLLSGKIVVLDAYHRVVSVQHV